MHKQIYIYCTGLNSIGHHGMWSLGRTKRANQ